MTKWHFTGLVNTICHQISLNSWGLCSTNEPLISLFNFFSSTTPTSYFHLGILFLIQIVHVALFLSTFSTSFLSFVSCSQWKCYFPSWVQLLQSWLGPCYSVLHTLLDFSFPPWQSPQRLPGLFLYQFFICRICLHMILVVMSFLVFHLSICLSYSFVHCIIPASYWTIGTAQILIAWNTFLSFNFDLRASLTHWKYCSLDTSFHLFLASISSFYDA